MGICLPADALSPEARKGRWRTMPYETASLSGTLLTAGPETSAPDITYPLDTSGTHAISVGILADSRAIVAVRIRLTGDDTFSVLKQPVVEGHGESIHELFWKVADLSQRGIEVGQMAMTADMQDTYGSNARFAYIKLVPLSSGEAEDWQADRQDTSNLRIFAHNDSEGLNHDYRPATAEEIRRHIEPLMENDFSRLYLESGMGDLMYYFSRIGRVPTYDGLDDFALTYYRMGVEAWRTHRDNDEDPFQIALDYAHEKGVELHASYRVGGFHFPPMHDHFNHGDSFYKKHPELRGTDRSGNATPRISYAYPEAREFVVSLLSEIAEFPIDGICLLYNRRPPLVEYEPPVVQGFIDEFGEDPRRLNPLDARWLSYRARVLTQFMREVREAMVAAARERGLSKPIEVSAVVGGTPEANLINGIDLEAWVEEGLVDTLIPYVSGSTLESSTESWTDIRDIDYFLSLTSGTPCKLAPNLMPRVQSPESFRERAASLYAAGVGYLFLWDSDPRFRSQYGPHWNALRRLGHKDEIESWVRAGKPSLASPVMPLVKLGDWDLTYATPG
jgi:hypothetical protein